MLRCHEIGRCSPVQQVVFGIYAIAKVFVLPDR